MPLKTCWGVVWCPKFLGACPGHLSQSLREHLVQKLVAAALSDLSLNVRRVLNQSPVQVGHRVLHHKAVTTTEQINSSIDKEVC